MKQFIIQVVVLLLVSFISFYLVFNPQLLNFIFGGNTLDNFLNTQSYPQYGKLKIKNQEILVEIADDSEERSIGLSKKAGLGANEGMLFIFPQPGIYSFWMKGMRFPIDIIWMRDWKVVDIDTNVPPADPNLPDNQIPKYNPSSQVNQVLEVQAGFVVRNNIMIGDSAELVLE